MRSYFLVYKVAFRFQNQIVFYNINCTVIPGVFFMIKGGNGTGKSTLLRCLLSNLRLQMGTFVPVTGIYNQSLYLPANRVLLFKDISVMDNLRFWHLIFNFETSLEYSLIVKLVYLKSFQTFQSHWLSLGQLKRLLLSFFLTMNKPVWVFDEPLIGLDLNSVSIFQQILFEHRLRGGLVFLISHTDLSIPRGVSLLL